MMYAKLALENVKKSTKDYLIYIVTLTACISMFYAFLSISSNYYDPNIGAEFNLDILHRLTRAHSPLLCAMDK